MKIRNKEKVEEKWKKLSLIIHDHFATSYNISSSSSFLKTLVAFTPYYVSLQHADTPAHR